MDSVKTLSKGVGVRVNAKNELRRPFQHHRDVRLENGARWRGTNSTYLYQNV